jgi:NAD kinase
MKDFYSYNNKNKGQINPDEIKTKVKYFVVEKHEHSIDLIITVGGDGTVLWASGLFQNRIVPPMVCFGKVNEKAFV